MVPVCGRGWCTDTHIVVGTRADSKGTVMAVGVALTLSIYYYGCWFLPQVHNSRVQCWESRQKHADTQLAGLVASKANGTGRDRKQARTGPIRCCRGPGCQYFLLWLHGLPMGMYVAVKASDRGWVKGVQVVAWGGGEDN